MDQPNQRPDGHPDERSGEHANGQRIEQLTSREVYRTPWMSVREDEVRFPDGHTGLFSVVDKANFVAVVPWSGDGFWLVRQFRYPVGLRAWEFPQGGWPAGHSGTPEQLAIAELGEEAGLTAQRLVHAGRLFAGYGFCSQHYDVYVALGLSEGTPQREDTESDMEHAWFSEADVRAMLADGRFPDAHSVAALALFDRARAAGELDRAQPAT